MGATALADARIVLDCRWQHRGGIGTLTERLLRGLHELAPAGTWVLWGDRAGLTPYLWGGATIAHTTGDAGRWMAQRGGWSRPSGDLFCALHQIRPLVLRQPVLQVIHDTIPLRTTSSRPLRAARRAYFRMVARTSRRILAVSEYSAGCVVRDLGVPLDRVRVIHYPVDVALVQRVAAIARTGEERFVLCPAGRTAPHKNLPRLVDAFSGTRFAADGGRLVILGTDDDGFAASLPTGVELRGWVAQHELDRLYATATAVVCPSVEEGFGFPAWDARCLGLPLATSTGGALLEAAGPRATRFSPTDVAAMRAAIDTVTAADAPVDVPPSGPTAREFAAEYVAQVEAALR